MKAGSWNDNFRFRSDSIYDVDGSAVVVAPRLRSFGTLVTWLFMGSHRNIAVLEMANVYLQSAGFGLRDPTRVANL